MGYECNEDAWASIEAVSNMPLTAEEEYEEAFISFLETRAQDPRLSAWEARTLLRTKLAGVSHSLASNPRIAKCGQDVLTGLIDHTYSSAELVRDQVSSFGRVGNHSASALAMNENLSEFPPNIVEKLAEMGDQVDWYLAGNPAIAEFPGALLHLYRTGRTDIQERIANNPGTQNTCDMIRCDIEEKMVDMESKEEQGLTM